VQGHEAPSNSSGDSGVPADPPDADVPKPYVEPDGSDKIAQAGWFGVRFALYLLAILLLAVSAACLVGLLAGLI
jgi:hypothetical protein